MFEGEVDVAAEAFGQMLRHNDFYLRDIFECCRTVKDAMARQADKTLL